jgi:TonB family protein
MKPFIIISVLMLSSLTFAQIAAPHGKALSQVELTALLATGSTSERLARLVQDRGIDFTPDEIFLKSLQEDEAGDPLLTALKSAEVRREEPPSKDPATSMKDSAALAHLHRAAQLNRNNLHPQEAEPELREAVAADPDNPFVHLALSEILARSGKADAAITEVRTALNLQPDISDAHAHLGNLLLQNPTQHREALEQLQQAVSLVPSDPLTHYTYARALEANGDKDGAAEQRKIADGLGGHPAPKRIFVGGQVESAKLVSQPPPRYPQKAKAAHIEGTVRLNVLIGKNGAVKDIAGISGDPILSEAAVKALWKWRYQPTLLNGQALEVVTEVDVNFSLK